MKLADKLAQLRHKGLYRSRRICDSAQSTEMLVDGRRCLAFCSNDYLGLANHPDVVAAFMREAQHTGVGSGASHLITGHHRLHHQLEEELAEFTGRDRALLFSTGYMANMGVVSALLGRSDSVFADRLNHASLNDACLLSGAQFRRYTHADTQLLMQQLADSSSAIKLVVTDGVFSMDGDIAPLPALVAAANTHDAVLMVDDAHGMGVLGEHGAGTLQQFGLGQQEVPILMGTLGKAFGSFGAFVAGSDELIEFLINRARTYIYTTALPPAVAAATSASLRLVRTENWRRDRLRTLIKYMRDNASAAGLALADSDTAIQILMVKSTEQAVRLSTALLENDILVPAIRPPTVPEGSARLRITLSAQHTEAQIDRLLGVLASALAQEPLS